MWMSSEECAGCHGSVAMTIFKVLKACWEALAITYYPLFYPCANISVGRVHACIDDCAFDTWRVWIFVALFLHKLVYSHEHVLIDHLSAAFNLRLKESLA